MGYFIDYKIDAKSLIHNIKQLRKIVAAAKFCAVVKANAYGLGVKNVCPIIKDYVDCFAVANVVEAEEIRTFDTTTPILILGVVDSGSLNWCAKNAVSVSIFSLIQLKSYCTEKLESVLSVHIKINSGMNRYGLKSLKGLESALKIITKAETIALQGIYTHFSTKDDDLAFIDYQFDFFKKFVEKVKDMQLLVHAANSFAALKVKKYNLDMVRVGFALYGEMEGVSDFKSVVSISSKIVAINNVKAGECVGYVNTFRASKNMKVAVVPCGYGDGLLRGLGNKFSLLVDGVECDILGMICMDCCMIDVTKVKSAFVGSEVVLLGKSCGKEITLKDYAKALGTSSYEILLNFDRKRMNKAIV